MTVSGDKIGSNGISSFSKLIFDLSCLLSLGRLPNVLNILFDAVDQKIIENMVAGKVDVGTKQLL